jgi:hypothetical protein
MAEEKKQTVVAPERPKPEPGFWSLPAGADGLHGSPESVLKAIAGFEDVPPHAKAALKDFIATELEGTTLNSITVHAHAQRRDDERGRHTLWTFALDGKKTLA